MISREKGSRRQQRDKGINAAKANFEKSNNLKVDSVYVIHDTAFYYTKGMFVGRTVTITE